MSCSLSFIFPKALPPHSTPYCRSFCLSIVSQHKQSHNPQPNKKFERFSLSFDCLNTLKKAGVGLQVASILTTVAQPAFAVTGVNDEEDIVSVLIQLGIAAFFYFLVTPPFIMNWLRIRWYRRGFVEMYFQFMFVFIFFPGLLLWAPFLNFRKFPRDPDMKYPWDKPEDPSKIKNAYLKYPWGTAEDYD